MARYSRSPDVRRSRAQSSPDARRRSSNAKQKKRGRQSSSASSSEAEAATAKRTAELKRRRHASDGSSSSASESDRPSRKLQRKPAPKLAKHRSSSSGSSSPEAKTRKVSKRRGSSEEMPVRRQKTDERRRKQASPPEVKRRRRDSSEDERSRSKISSSKKNRSKRDASSSPEVRKRQKDSSPDVKQRRRRDSSVEVKKQRRRKDSSSPEVPRRRRKDSSSPEVEQRRRKKAASPEVKQRRRKDSSSPEIEQRRRSKVSPPKTKQRRRKKESSSPEVKPRRRKDSSSPEVEQRRRSKVVASEVKQRRRKDSSSPEVERRRRKDVESPVVKQRRRKDSSSPEVKQRRRKDVSPPEVEHRRRKDSSSPEVEQRRRSKVASVVKQRKRKESSSPDVKQRRRKVSSSPEVKHQRRKQSSSPEPKPRRRKDSSSPEVKQRRRKETSSPDVKERRAKFFNTSPESERRRKKAKPTRRSTSPEVEVPQNDNRRRHDSSPKRRTAERKPAKLSVERDGSASGGEDSDAKRPRMKSTVAVTRRERSPPVRVDKSGSPASPDNDRAASKEPSRESSRSRRKTDSNVVQESGGEEKQDLDKGDRKSRGGSRDGDRPDRRRDRRRSPRQYSDRPRRDRQDFGPRRGRYDDVNGRDFRDRRPDSRRRRRDDEGERNGHAGSRDSPERKRPRNIMDIGNNDQKKDETLEEGEIKDDNNDEPTTETTTEPDPPQAITDAAQPNAAQPEKKKEKTLTTRTGGAYIPPAKLRMMQAQITDKSSMEFQRLAWEALKKSLNGLVNKVNVSNIEQIAKELLAENIVRGRGLLTRSMIQAQQASPTFTHVYAALAAIVNSKFPSVGDLLVQRLILQFKRGFKRNDKNIIIASTRFVGHLVNQEVLHEIIALEILMLLLEKPTEDSVEVAVAFLKEVGEKLSEVAPRGLSAIIDRMRAILHESSVDKRVQYMIEVMMAIKKDGFKDHKAVVSELDVVPEEAKYTHMKTLDDPADAQAMLNVFKHDPEYEANEEKYAALKKEMLASSSESESGDDSGDDSDSDSDSASDKDEIPKQVIVDETETNMVALRKTIYLTIQSSLDFEECAHKMLKLEIKPGQESEVCNMVLDCCGQQRTYEKFYGLLAQRFCMLRREYMEPYHTIFKDQYQTIHRLETNKLRNVAKFFAHLLHTDSISWEVLEVIKLNEEDTSSSGRIFIKFLFQDLSEYMGLTKLNARLQDETLQPYFEGIMPRDSPKHTRFAINFFTTIGLGGLTDSLRDHLKNVSKQLAEQKQKEAALNKSSSSSSSDSSDSDSSDSSDSSSSSSDDARGRKRKSEYDKSRRKSKR